MAQVHAESVSTPRKPLAAIDRTLEAFNLSLLSLICLRKQMEDKAARREAMQKFPQGSEHPKSPYGMMEDLRSANNSCWAVGNQYQCCQRPRVAALSP